MPEVLSERRYCGAGQMTDWDCSTL